MYFDTHAHYCDQKFDRDRFELLDSMIGSEISLVLNAGSSLSSSKSGLELADKYPFVYASAGIHPHAAKKMTNATLTELEELLKHPKAVAVGEIGLDYHYDFSPRNVQKKRFREQLELARSLKKPVIIHEREALSDTLEIVSDYKDLTGVFHCFSGSRETSKIILDLGWYLSFTGVITFKSARRVIDAIKRMPAERILLETDCPYMTPEPKRGKRCTSFHLPLIAARIAELRRITTEEVASITMENGKRLFGIE
jgi:TatD DNase family protein